jgi:hypothetical protein
VFPTPRSSRRSRDRRSVDLPPHLCERLASALESGHLGSSPTPTTFRSVLGSRDGAEDVVASLLKLGQLGILGLAAAAWLRTIANAAARTPKPDLVWSGPEFPGLHARDTRRVYEELLGTAERSIWVSTYVFFDGPKAFEVLARDGEGADLDREVYRSYSWRRGVSLQFCGFCRCRPG